jgi:hypothetical protein
MIELHILRLDNAGLVLEELPRAELLVGITVELVLFPKSNVVIAVCSLKPTIGVFVPKV